MITRALNLFSSKAAFCREIGMTPQFLTQIERGKRPVPPRFAIAIERATGGVVSVHDLRPDIFGPAPSEAA